ncbi:MAG: hypothetical protein HQL63_14805 [Magnetococcales bacterium]|nr:hypothetical protein [Magnetococcales bacterium]MBF0322730.1 hypothetical protein [Magnetococcales bacterium]
MNAHILSIASCATSLSPGQDIRLFPSGSFSAVDGRPGALEGTKITAWKIDAQTAARVIADFQGKARDLVIDYEHQSMYAVDNGLPAPAAGWIKNLLWQEGTGLLARVEWTARAAEMIRSGEYRYISPTFSFDPKTGAVTALLNAALTNNPALPGLGEVLARYFPPTKKEQDTVSLAAIAQALALAETASEQEIVTALTAMQSRMEKAEAMLLSTVTSRGNIY